MIDNPEYSVSQGYVFGEPVYPPVYNLYRNGARLASFANISDATYTRDLLNSTTREQRESALVTMWTDPALRSRLSMEAA